MRLIAQTNPVVVSLARNTMPNAPRPRGRPISKVTVGLSLAPTVQTSIRFRGFPAAEGFPPEAASGAGAGLGPLTKVTRGCVDGVAGVGRAPRRTAESPLGPRGLLHVFPSARLARRASRLLFFFPFSPFFLKNQKPPEKEEEDEKYSVHYCYVLIRGVTQRKEEGGEKYSSSVMYSHMV